MDGLPGLRRGVETARRENVRPIKKMVGPYATTIHKARSGGGKTVSVWYLLVVAVLSFCTGVVAMQLIPAHILHLLN